MICRVCQNALARSRPRATNATTTRILNAASFHLSNPQTIPTTRLLSQCRPRNLGLGTPSSILQGRRFTSTPTCASQSDTTSTADGAPLQKPDYLDAAETWIWDKLAVEFSPSDMVVRDVSGGCGSMYAIDITSDKFRGANMLKQQRMVNSVLGDKVKEWHGLQLKTRAP